ncbi:26_t:CDS:1, partial [Gigaspora rosea]
KTNSQYTKSSICIKSKVLDNKKMNNFLNQKEKKKIRDIILKRNREKKPQELFNNFNLPISKALTMLTSSISDTNMSKFLNLKT